MPKKFYSKELPDQPVYVNGFPLRFDIVETEDPTLIRELDNCVRNGMGGVVAITQEQYAEEVKKKELGILSNGSSNKPPWRTELSANQRLNAAVVGGSFAKPQQPPQVAIERQPQQMPDKLSVPDASEFVIKPPATAKLNKPMP